MKKLYILFTVAIIGLLLSSCIKLRVDNPEMKYYDLSNEENVPICKNSVNSSLQIRTFTLTAKQSADRILVTEDGLVNPLYYHRWVSGFDDLVSDFIFVRFTKSQAFQKGVLTARSMQTPDYTLEGRIIEYTAVNDTKSKPEQKYIRLSIGIALIHRDTKTGITNSILNKEYTEKVERPDKDAFGIHVAYKTAITKIADQMLEDITKTIAKENNN